MYCTTLAVVVFDADALVTLVMVVAAVLELVIDDVVDVPVGETEELVELVDDEREALVVAGAVAVEAEVADAEEEEFALPPAPSPTTAVSVAVAVDVDVDVDVSPPVAVVLVVLIPATPAPPAAANLK